MWHASCINERVLARWRPISWRGVSLPLVLTLSISLHGASAHATPESQATARELARALADQGADAYAEADYARAQLFFARAYELVRAPTIALFEARALVKLERFRDAIAVYRRAAEAKLTSSAPAAFHDAARSAATELAALSPRVPRVRVVLDAETKADPELELWLDGRRLEAHELAGVVHVDPGAHRLEVRGTAVSKPRVSFTLAESQTKVIEIDSQAKPPSTQRMLAYVSLGVGAAALATGVTAGVISMNAHGDAERLCESGTCPANGPGRDALDRFRTFRAVSTVGYVLGAVGVGAGVGLLIFKDDASSREVTLSASLDEIRLEGRW